MISVNPLPQSKSEITLRIFSVSGFEMKESDDLTEEGISMLLHP
jgi:hypothetical protein